MGRLAVWSFRQNSLKHDALTATNCLCCCLLQHFCRLKLLSTGEGGLTQVSLSKALTLLEVDQGQKQNTPSKRRNASSLQGTFAACIALAAIASACRKLSAPDLPRTLSSSQLAKAALPCLIRWHSCGIRKQDHRACKMAEIESVAASKAVRPATFKLNPNAKVWVCSHTSAHCGCFADQLSGHD